MAAAPSPETYKEIILFLVTAGVVVPLFHRLRISPVLGFIGAGALLGPYGLGRLAGDVPGLHWFTIASRDEIAHLAEFGVVFLLFMIGLELSWERLRRMRRLVFGLGSLQVLVSAVAIGAAAAALGLDPIAAAIVGLALALSSTAIVVPVLAEGRRLNAPVGRASFSILLFQDLAVAPILFTVTLLRADDGDGTAAAFLLVLLKAAMALVLIVGVGRLVLRPLFQFVAATRSSELFMAACLLVVIAAALLSAASGLSMALGAFTAGLLLAETEYRRAIETTIEPFKGLLLGVFFVSVGMGLNAGWLIENPGPILGLALALVALKTAILLVLALSFGLKRHVAIETALLLGPGGEFAFVTLGAAMAGGLVPAPIGMAILVVVTVTMIAIPIFARFAARLGRRIERLDLASGAVEPPPRSDEPRVIVAGFGRVGQLVAEMLTRHKVPYIAIDANPALVTEHRRAGKPVYFGDSANPNFLHASGVETARALVVTIDIPSAVEAIVETARRLRPDLTIVARARDSRHATALYDLGVDDAVPENFEASLQLSEAVLVDIGVPMGLVIASIHERRDEARKVFKGSGKAASPERRPEFRGRRTAGKRAS
jgi:monovalent cation:H+ antiporter-2, CPA2 family